MRRFNHQPLLSPSDLNNLLECRHLMALEQARFNGNGVPRSGRGAHVDILARYGEQHESAILDAYEASGRSVERVVTGPGEHRFRAALEQTLAAMRGGLDVIHQATLMGDGFGGYADFLERVPRPSGLGDWSYEVADAKLARATKGYFLVQLSVYAALLERIQDLEPQELVVLLGDGRRDAYRTDEFAAYVRRIRRYAEETIAAGVADTYPVPCGHCGICDYRHHCEGRRRADDHLSLVAGMRRDQVVRLEEHGVSTLAALATLAPDRRIPRIPRDSLTKLRSQAALQLRERETGTQCYELLAYEPRFGFGLLPEPAPGDLYFDVEGDPYIGDRGLVYLFGIGWHDAGGERYEAFWAHSTEDEKTAFEGLVDFVMAWREQHPGCHVYHYGAIEETMLKQLAMYHATRELEVDTLLRADALVDLYRVVRQGVRISKESYSLKKVEDFYWNERTAAVKEAGGSIVAYEQWMGTGDQSQLDDIALYNAEDVHSTRGLRDWLLELRAELAATGAAVEWRPAPGGAEDAAEEIDPETAGLRDTLLATGDAVDRLLGELLMYHRREAKPSYWWYFKRLEMTEEELRDEDDESIGGLTPAGPEFKLAQSRGVPMQFPLQSMKLYVGDVVDPASKRGAEIVEIDQFAGTLTLKLGPKKWGQDPPPRSLIPDQPLPTGVQRAALRRLAVDVIAGGSGYPASRALLRRDLPRIAGSSHGRPLLAGDYTVAQAVDLALRLESSMLAIQGPPGTGKTYAGARIAVALMARGRRVGVTAPSHKAIHNLLEEIERIARHEGVAFKGYKRGDDENAYESPFGSAGSIENVGNPACENAPADVLLVAGTSWLFAREKMQGTIDTLLVDEAGQVSLADALAVATSCRNLILLGDPQQLAHVAQGGHPEGTAVSALAHVLGGDATIAPERGLFINVSRRMHPDVCAFVSEISYRGELHSLPECGVQRVDSRGLSGTGLRWFPVEHSGNRRESPEEGDLIAGQLDLLAGGSVIRSDGSTVPIQQAGVMVVTPYNAQVRLLRDRLPEWVDVGTVDKFQGREAGVVFFSMATSSGEDVPRNAEFLYSRNRLNVAVSRAKCLAVLVASPDLLTVRCRTVEQMRLVNALCRFVERATSHP
jgi:predicted RecB family nuclease